MTVLNQTIEVERPVEEVFRYVSDFQTCQEWDATATAATRLNPGPVGKGARYQVFCALPVGQLELEYEITDYVENEKVVLLGKGRFFDVEDTILFSPTESGCEVDYTARFDYRAGMGAIAPAMKSGLERMGYESIQVGMKQALEDDYPAPETSRANARSDRFLPSALSLFSRRGYTRGKKHWNPVSAYMVGKHAVITGATDGLGLATTKALAAMGASLTLVVRNQAKGEALLDELAETTGNTDIRLEIADLSLMADIDKVIKSLKKRKQTIDILINNAGALFNPRAETSEGLEQSFALLLLGPYRLTEGLYPLLKAADSARVINVVSGGMYSQKLRLNDLQNERNYSGSVAYARAKRALMIKTEQWAEDWADDGIVVNAMHPGWADTPGVETALPGFHKITKRILRSPEEGADTIVWLAAATEADQTSGRLFLDREPRTTHLLKQTQESEAEREELRKVLDTFEV